ncbi:unnamed protein product [Ixodes persulcatus]
MLPTTSRSAGGPDSCSWQTAWSFRLRRRPIMVALSPQASPSSGDSLNSETWNPDSTHGHPSARESLRQAAASSLRGERLWRGRPGGGRAIVHFRPRQSRLLPETPLGKVPLRHMISLGGEVSNSRRATTARDSPGRL